MTCMIAASVSMSSITTCYHLYVDTPNLIWCIFLCGDVTEYIQNGESCCICSFQVFEVLATVSLVEGCSWKVLLYTEYLHIQGRTFLIHLYFMNLKQMFLWLIPYKHSWWWSVREFSYAVEHRLLPDLLKFGKFLIGCINMRIHLRTVLMNNKI